MKRAGRQALERSHFLTFTLANEKPALISAAASRQRITRRPEEAYRTALLSDSPTEGVRYAGGRDCGSERGRGAERRAPKHPQCGRARSLLRCSLTTRA